MNKFRYLFPKELGMNCFRSLKFRYLSQHTLTYILEFQTFIAMFWITENDKYFL